MIDTDAGTHPAIDRGAALPALRRDVHAVAKTGRTSTPGYYVECAASGAVLELSAEAWFLCRQLTGETDAAEILRRFEEQFGTRLAPENLEAFVRQLGDQGYLEQYDASRWRASLADLFVSQKLFVLARCGRTSGDRFFAGLARRFRWWFGWPAVWAALGMVAVGVAVLATSWSEFFQAAMVEYDNDLLYYFFLFCSTSLIPSIRNLVHGAVLKHYGGQVSEMGVLLFFYVSPSFYCDFSDFAFLSDRRQRYWTILSGPCAQLVLAAVAIFGWRVTTPGSGFNMAWLALATTCLVLFVFVVANPLAPYEGSLLLCQWLEEPRLQERAIRLFGAWMQRAPRPEPIARGRRPYFVLYGGAVCAYTALLMLVPIAWIGVKLMKYFQGAGAMATVGVALFTLQRPLGEAAGSLRPVRWLRARKRRFGRWGWRVGWVIIILLLANVPYPYETGGLFTIRADTRTEVHCEVDGGRITKVFVREGESVQTGQPIAQIDQREYQRNVVITRAQLSDVEARLRLLRKNLALLSSPPNIEEIQALEAEEHRLQALLADFENQLVLTTLRAPLTGRVTTPLVEQAVGTYVKKGDLVASVELPTKVLVEIQVPEWDVPQVEIGARVRVTPWAYPNETFPGTVKSIAPIAFTPTGSTSSQQNSVRVMAELPNRDLRFHSYTTGFAKIQTKSLPVWFVASRLVIRWFQVQVWYWLP